MRLKGTIPKKLCLEFARSRQALSVKMAFCLRGVGRRVLEIGIVSFAGVGVGGIGGSGGLGLGSLLNQ